MVKNVSLQDGLTFRNTWGGYNSPKVKVVDFQPEGVLCSSVINGHQGFIFDDEEIL